MGSRISQPARFAAILGLGLLLSGPTTAGPVPAELPAALGRWFTSDPSVTCVTPSGRDRRCAMSQVEHTEVKRSPAGSVALVFVTYLPDPTATGNATKLAAAAFRKEAGGWRLVRSISAPGGIPAGEFAFAGETATYAVEVAKPGDPRCCPSGRRQVSVDIR